MSHYFDRSPPSASAPIRVDASLGDVAFSFDTDRGVFSRGRLDAGTRVLLRHADPLPSTGHLADIGCGAGPIALTMALRAPNATVWAIDVNERARDLTAANAQLNNLSNLNAVAPEEVPESVAFAAWWSNPPIRIGKAALQELVQFWLQRLEPAAAATLVVNKHLGADSLQRWLESRGDATERIASKGGFRLIRVCPRSATG